MSNQFKKATNAFVVSAFASLLLALGLASSALAQQQPPPKPPKKKLQASSNFAQYAGRDASNRLIAGGATRDMTVTDDAGALSIKGREAYEAGRYEEAVADFRKVTEMEPGSARAFYELGVAYETAGRNKEAGDERYESAERFHCEARTACSSSDRPRYSPVSVPRNLTMRSISPASISLPS